MRTFALFTLVIALLSPAACAQEVTVTPALPEIATPPGATLLTEINLSETDILGMIKQAIPAFAQSAAGAPGELGVFLKTIDLNAFAEAIEGVRFIRVMQFKLPPEAKPGGLFGFYEEQLQGSGEWTRVLYDASMPAKGVVAIYTRGGEDFFGLGIAPGKKRAVAFRTVGFVDVPKLAAWAGRTAKFVADMEAKQKAAAAKRAAAAKKPPAKRPATKKK